MKPRILLIRERAAGDGEYPDPTPVHVPGESMRPPPLKDMVAEMVQAEVARRMATEDQLGGDPVEDEWDFDIHDEFDQQLSDYQVLEMVEEFEAENGPIQDLEPIGNAEDQAAGAGIESHQSFASRTTSEKDTGGSDVGSNPTAAENPDAEGTPST